MFMSVSPVMAVVEFNDGGVWDIDYEIIDDVWVDFETPGMGTTLNILEGGSILPRNLLKGFEDSIINMSGGLIGSLWAHDNSQVTISGGAIEEGFRAGGNSQVTISGGWLSYLDAYGSSQVTVSGGLLGGEIQLEGNAIVTIEGSDFAVDGIDVGYIELFSIGGRFEPYRRLTGTLLNGDSLDSDFRIGNSAKIVLIPEPAMLLLLGFGGMAFVRRRRQG